MVDFDRSASRVILRSAVAFPRRSRRSWRVSRLWRDQHPAHPAGGDLHAPQHLLLGNPQGTVAGMLQAVVEDGLLDLGRHPVGVRSPGAWPAVDEALGPLAALRRRLEEHTSEH